MSLRKRVDEDLKKTYLTEEHSRKQTKRELEKANHARVNKVCF